MNTKHLSLEKTVKWTFASILTINALIAILLAFTSHVQAQTAQGSVLMKAVGSDLSVGTVPANIQLKYDAFPVTLENPKSYASQTATVHSFYTSYTSAYPISVGTCTYQQGGSECQVTNFSDPFSLGIGNRACDQNAGFCRYDAQVSENQVTKVVWKYTTSDTSQVGLNSSKGDVLISRVGPDQSTLTAPANTTASMTGFSSVSTNKALFLDAVPSTFDDDTYEYDTNYYVSAASGYTLSVGSCQYDRGTTPCSPSYYSAINSSTDCTLTTCTIKGGYYAGIVTANKVTNIVVIYTPNDTGDVVIKRIDPSGNLITGTSAWITGFATTTTNVAVFSNAPVKGNPDAQIFYVTPPAAGYGISVQVCQYARGATPCSGGTSYDVTGCTSTTCSLGSYYWYQSVWPGTVSYITVTYKPLDTGDVIIRRVDANGNIISGTSAWMTGFATTTTNAAVFSNAPIKSNSDVQNFYVTPPSAGYSVSVQMCQYARGGTPCSGGTPIDITCTSTTCNLGPYFWYQSVWPNTVSYITASYKLIGSQTSGSNADVLVKTVGSDLYMASTPSGAQVRLDNSSFTTQNPTTYTNQTLAAHTVYTKTVQNYSVSVGQCSYTRGTSECSVSSFSAATCDTLAGTCSYSADLTSYTNKVYKVVWKYDSLVSGDSTGDIMVKAVGSDLYTSSAPAGTSLGVDSLSKTTVNPYTYTNQSIGYTNHSVYATYNPSYAVSVGSCQYSRGGNECSVASFNPVAIGIGSSYCDQNTNLCRYDVSVDSNKVTKVAWRYVYDNKTTGNPDTASIDIKLKWVGTDLTTGTAPSGSIMSVDSYVALTNNPSTYPYLPVATHQVYAKAVSGYNISMGYCVYPRGGNECLVTNFQPVTCDISTGLCGINISQSYGVEGYKVSKVVAKYDLATGGTGTEQVGTNINKGDVIIKHVGPDQTTATAPNSGALGAWLDGIATSTSNPAVFTDLTPAGEGYWNTYHYYIKNVPGYTITYATCKYDRGTLPCTPTNYYSGAGNIDCTPTTCKISFADNIQANRVTKIVIVYTPTDTGDLVVQYIGPDETSATAPSASLLAVWSEGIATSSASNPASYSNIAPLSEGWWGGYHYYVKSIPGYTISYGSCKYPRGSTPCSTTSLHTYPSDSSWFECSGDTCKLVQADSIQANYVTKLTVVYTPAQTGDVEIIRSGPGDTPIGGTSAWMQGVATTTSNSAQFTNVTVGTQTFYVTPKVGYDISVFTCQYPRGGTKCNPSYGPFNVSSGYYTYDPYGYAYNLTCNSSMCSIKNVVNGGVDVRANYVTRVSIQYVPNGQVSVDPYATDADVKMKAVGADLTTNTVPSGTQMNMDTTVLSSTNPSIKYNVDTSSDHIFYATYNEDYAVTVGSCAYVRNSPECSVTNFQTAVCDSTTGRCSYDSYFSDDYDYNYNGYVYKLVWKYDLKTEGSFTGDVKVKRVGADLYTSSAPASKISVDNKGLTSVNPTIYTNLSTTYHTFYGSYMPQTYVTTVGSCQYQRGGSECAVTNFQVPTQWDQCGAYNPTPCNPHTTCDTNTGLCSWQYKVDADMVTKVVWKYDLLQTSTLTLTNSGDQSIGQGQTSVSTITATKGSGALDQIVTWSVTGLPNGAVATFSPASCTTNCSTTLSIATPATIPLGTYPIKVVASPSGVYSQFNLIVSNSAKILVSSVVCDAESYLPNWADPTIPNGRPAVITQTTAETYVANNSNHCKLDTGWGYQWGFPTAPKSAGDFEGQITPGTGPNDWRNFDSPTASLGFTYQPAVAVIGDLNGNPARLNIRENLKSGYVPFSANPVIPYNNVSAELFCNNDGVHYDNHDYVFTPTLSKTYYCVSFNAPITGTGDLEIKGVDTSSNVVTTSYMNGTVESGKSTSLSYPVSVAQNPKTITTLTPGAYTIKVANHGSETDGLVPQVGQCFYAQGGTDNDCQVTDFNVTPPTENGVPSDPIVPVCDTNWCTYTTSVVQGKTTKVVFKYDVANNVIVDNDPLLYCYASPSNPTAGTRVTWTAVMSPTGNYNYSWSGSGSDSTDIFSGSTVSVQKTYTKTGVKTATVQVTGDATASATCTTKVGSKPSYVEF